MRAHPLLAFAIGLLAAPAVPASSKPADSLAHATQAAVAGAVVADLALRCRWETDPGLVLQAKTTALMLATQDIRPDKRRYEAMASILASEAMAAHPAQAALRQASGGCKDASERAKWTGLLKMTQAVLAAKAADPAPSASVAAPPPL